MKPVLDLYSGSSAENQPTELQHIFMILLMELTAILFNSGSEELEPTLEYYFVNILWIFDFSGSKGTDCSCF